jgi:hypothetical protein
LSFKLKKNIYKINKMGRRDFFDYRKESIPSKGRYYLAKGYWDKVPLYVDTHRKISETKVGNFIILELEKP